MFASVLPISDYHKDVNPRYEMSKPRPPATILELNRWIQSFCAQRRYHNVDYFSQMADPSGYMKSELADDGLHPNSAGYRMMGPIAVATIDRVFAPPPSAPAPISKSPASKSTVSKARVSKAKEKKPAAEPAQAAARRSASSEAPPAPAPQPPAQTAHTAQAVPPPAADKPAETQPSGTATPTPAKKKKDSFWKRTYPTSTPK
jgi:hypothetical protein